MQNEENTTVASDDVDAASAVPEQSRAGVDPQSEKSTNTCVINRASLTDDAQSDAESDSAAPVRKALKIYCHNCSQKLDVTYLDSFAHFSCPSCSADLIVPKWFDNYLLEEPGGIGGMATVYRALDIALDREVAIKILKPEVATEQDRSELFLNEARTAATINHYAVVPIYTCGVFEDQTYIIMQYMSGGSLEMKLKLSHGILPVKDVVHWIHDIAEGLDNARVHGIVHHDIKPGNILLDMDGNAKIGDFGIAQIISDSTSSHVAEMTGSWVSPHYVSPEKIRTGKEDFRGDIYSLGATFYHLATGCPPYAHADVDELIRMRLSRDPQPPHLHRAELGMDLSRLILAMMERSPEQRPSYKEIVKILSNYMKKHEGSGSGVEKVLRSPSVPLVVKKPIVVQKNVLESMRNRPERRGGYAVHAVVTLILLLVLCGTGYFAWAHGKLQTLLPFLPAPVLAGISADQVPENSMSFALGNPAAVIEFSEPLLDNAGTSLEIMNQAGLQMAIACYLAALPDANERCSTIFNRLKVVNVTPDQMEISGAAGSVMDVVQFLGSEDLKPADLAGRLAKAPADMAAAGKLAILLKAIRKQEQGDQWSAQLAEVASSLKTLPEKSWIAASWRSRLPYWKQTLDSHSGKKADLEELFRGVLTSEADWTFVPVDAARIFQDFEMPGQIKVGFADDVDSVENGTASSGDSAPDSGVKAPSAPVEEVPREFALTEQAITQNMKRYSGRPVPIAPAALNREEIKAYLKQLPEADRQFELARARILLETKDYLTTLMLRIPYEAESFATISHSYGPGVVMANPNYLSYRSKKGKRTRLEWKEIPVEEFMRIIFHYAKLRGNAIGGSDMKSPEVKKVLAWDYLRLAVLSAWYGNHTDAFESAGEAMNVYPEIAPDVYRLLLR